SLYFLLYIIAFYIFIRNSLKVIDSGVIMKLFFGLFCILVLSDIMLISYFNSFYQEALFLLISLLIAGQIIRRSPNSNLLLFLFLILCFSKPQNLIFMIIPLYLLVREFKTLNKVFLIPLLISSLFFMY